MTEHVVIGLMSGTSIDGLDIAMCSFSQENGKIRYRILKTKSVEYSNTMRKTLLNLHILDGENLVIEDANFAKFCANEVNLFIRESNLNVDLIASHGHTVFHRPSSGYTLQIGNGQIIAKITSIPCVYDFRSGDVALGGNGAPLVPIGDELLFSDFDACLNIGGFSNISYRNEKGSRIAYDISPVNIVLNELSRRLGYEYDDSGKIAESGKLNTALLKELDSLLYYHQDAPKSLSREWVENNINPLLVNYSFLSTEDLIHTFAVHSARMIAKELNDLSSVLITGGGAKNKFFISTIRNNTKANIIIPVDELIDFKEAIVFAFLGYLRWNNKINCLASVTGASKDSSGGSIAMP
jgi:anhydro-N-acetylmuramic acid kinase